MIKDGDTVTTAWLEIPLSAVAVTMTSTAASPVLRPSTFTLAPLVALNTAASLLMDQVMFWLALAGNTPAVSSAVPSPVRMAADWVTEILIGRSFSAAAAVFIPAGSQPSSPFSRL
ncbi:hypothetical protein D3C76_1251040 [compost metagenome]